MFVNNFLIDMRIPLFASLILLTSCAVITDQGKLELRHPADIYTYNPKFPVFNDGCKMVYAITYDFAQRHYHNRDFFLYPTNDVLRCVDYSFDPKYRKAWNVLGIGIFSIAMVF
jgi:hypothetical protein